MQQVKYLGRDYVVEVYDDAIRGGRYGYLLIDLHGGTPRDMRLRTKIFPEDVVIVVYQFK